MCIDMLEKNLEEALEAVWLTGSNRLLRRHGEGRREPELRIAHAAIIAAGRRLGSFWDPGAHAENTGVEPETAAEIQGNPKGEKRNFAAAQLDWMGACMFCGVICRKTWWTAPFSKQDICNRLDFTQLQEWKGFVI